jgi:hypothetical protein
LGDVAGFVNEENAARAKIPKVWQYSKTQK